MFSVIIVTISKILIISVHKFLLFFFLLFNFGVATSCDAQLQRHIKLKEKTPKIIGSSWFLLQGATSTGTVWFVILLHILSMPVNGMLCMPLRGREGPYMDLEVRVLVVVGSVLVCGVRVFWSWGYFCFWLLWSP